MVAFIQWLVLATFFLIAPAAWPTQKQPNYVIHIMADDLGYGEIGSFGQTLIHTPNLDSLAAEGLTFTHYYAGSALCNPSRYAMMVGQHAGTSGITDNSTNTLYPDAYNIALVMKQGGYKTALFGKWALGRVRTHGAPLKQGFDTFFGYDNQRDAHNYFPEKLWLNNRPYRLKGNRQSRKRNISEQRVTYAPKVIQQRVLAFIRNNREEKLYLQIDLNLPHVNNELHAVSGNGFEHPGESRYSDRPWSEAEQSYAELVSIMDDYVGEIVEQVRDLGIASDTLIIFTSDNGPTGVRTPETLEKFRATAGLRGMKGMLYEGGLRVPTIAWWPGTVPANTVTPLAITFWDLLPTLTELTGQEPTRIFDGTSFAKLLTEQQHPVNDRPLYWELGERRALILGNWKWVHHPVQIGPADQLFDLAADPTEQHNLILEKPGQLAKLKQIANQLRIH